MILQSTERNDAQHQRIVVYITDLGLKLMSVGS